jgi:hypothetical protein
VFSTLGARHAVLTSSRISRIDGVLMSPGSLVRAPRVPGTGPEPG